MKIEYFYLVQIEVMFFTELFKKDFLQAVGMCNHVDHRVEEE